MDFVVMTEVGRKAPKTFSERYWEVVEEAQFAEEMGFDAFAVSEHHFNEEIATCSALETFLTALAMRTKRIRLRAATFVLPFSHPVRVAEEIASLDIFSNGRVDVGTGRGNYLSEMEGFGISPTETRARWDECLDIIVKALSQPEFSYDGKYFKIPPRSLVPRPVQEPHPPIWTAATSLEGSYLCGQKGMGEMTFSNFMGFDIIDAYRKRYREGQRDPKPIVKKNHDRFSVFVLAHCAEDTETARREAGEAIVGFAVFVCTVGYPMLAKASADYGYMGKVEELGDRVKDLDFLSNDSGMVVLGDPDECVRQVERYAALGVEEMIFRIDAMPHDAIMRSIQLFGEEVIPKFRAERGAEKKRLTA